MDWSSIIPYVATFLIGLLFAFAELLSRYRDNTTDIMRVAATYFYLAINGGVCILTYWLIQENNLTFGGWGDKTPGKVIIAGLSSMLILRSSFFSVKSGDKTFDAGLASMMQIFLNKADRAFDQRMAQTNLTRITSIMEKVEFKNVEISLPTTCLTIMQNLSYDEQRRMGDEVQKLSALPLLDGRSRSINLGIIVSRFTGFPLLETAVKTLSAAGAGQTVSALAVDDQSKQELRVKAAQVMEKLKSNV